MTATIGHAVIGPDTHGVVRYATALADVLGRNSFSRRGNRQVAESMPHSSDDIPAALTECTLVHVHVTDRLFGGNAVEARHGFVDFLRRVGTDVSTTLHDVPGPSDGAGFDARVAFYRTVCDLSAGVAVSSRHEETLLNRHVDSTIRPSVIPLMISAPVVPATTIDFTADPTVGVLGFLYPGKGHIETLRAMADLPASIGFVALGTASPGHEYLEDELYECASAAGRACEVTGFLDDTELRRRTASVTVPVAFHRHMSASGSINTWIESGRRPLVPTTAYTEELEQRSPGLLLLHGNDEGSLTESITASLADPPRTWIDPSVTPEPSPAAVAEAYDAAFSRWMR